MRRAAVILLLILAGCHDAPPKPYPCDIRTNDHYRQKSGCVSRDDWVRDWRPVLSPD